MQTIEILAPAGSMESVIAAANAGADAVYFGMKSFSARASAANFDEHETTEAIRFLKARGMKAYLTLNTLFFDNEKAALFACAESAIKAGVDAFIVQDLGLFSILKHSFPQVQYHASTQMSVHSVAGAKELEELGFRRVVLGRELSRGQIEEISQNTNIDLEVFVHGALCISVSGNCYASSMIGARSGNRGRCAQTCRLPFSLGDTKTDDYVLSLKDLSLVEQAKELAEIGVHSLKIEGRMKRPEYVAAVADALYSEQNDLPYNKDHVYKVFSRSGFTKGYFDNDLRDMFGVRTKANVLESKGRLKEIASRFRHEKQRFGVEFTLTLDVDTGATLKAYCNGREASVHTQVQQASHTPTDQQQAQRSLSKTGNTPYFCKSVAFYSDRKSYIPASGLNQLRRTVLEELEEQLVTFMPPKKTDTLRMRTKSDCEGFFYVGRFERVTQLDQETLSFFKQLVLPLKECVIQIDTLSPYIENITIELPYTLFTWEDRVLAQLKEAKKLGYTKVQVNNIAHLQLAREAKMEFEIGWRMNVLNSYSAQFLEDLGAKQIGLSCEISLKSARQLQAQVPVGVFAYGHLPVMTMRVCPIRERMGCKTCKKQQVLTDRLGNKFPTGCTEEAFYLFNPQPIYLSDRVGELCGIDFGVLYFTKENLSQIKEILKDFTNRTITREKGSYTRGLLYRQLI